MNEIEKRVVEAIEVAYRYDEGVGISTSLRMARAAIAAMRKPTDSMLAAGALAIDCLPDDWKPNAAYQAMIFAALSSAPIGEK